MSKLNFFILICSIILIQQYCSAGKRILTKIIARSDTASELGNLNRVFVSIYRPCFLDDSSFYWFHSLYPVKILSSSNYLIITNSAPNPNPDGLGYGYGKHGSLGSMGSLGGDLYGGGLGLGTGVGIGGHGVGFG